MALIKCAECGKDMSDKATACPNCGNPIDPSDVSRFFSKDGKPFPVNATPEKKQGIGIMSAALVGFAILLPLTLCSSPSSTSTSPKAPADPIAEARFQKTAMFAAGLKSKMRDPSSFVLESARANEDASVICLEYRARNGFGGMNKEFIVGTTKRVSQDATAWNKYCTKPLIDMSHIEYALK